MRVNVYGEEITGEVRVVEKDGRYGLRVYLDSPASLHNTADDDDRSAVTFWGMCKVEDILRAADIELHAWKAIRDARRIEGNGHAW